MSKKLIIIAFFLGSVFAASAQLNPVLWSFSAVKTGDKTYEIHMKATIQKGWHLYSQSQPDDAIAMPTTFTINPNPLFSKEGKIKELGSMEKMNDETLGVTNHQYSNTVDFVQKIKLKTKAKTNFTGNVEFQTCDDKKCLPAKKVTFNVVIQ